MATTLYSQVSVLFARRKRGMARYFTFGVGQPYLLMRARSSTHTLNTSFFDHGSSTLIFQSRFLARSNQCICRICSASFVSVHLLNFSNFCPTDHPFPLLSFLLSVFFSHTQERQLQAQQEKTATDEHPPAQEVPDTPTTAAKGAMATQKNQSFIHLFKCVMHLHSLTRFRFHFASHS